jgi:DNA-binding NarL/FixJ family response regulator
VAGVGGYTGVTRAAEPFSGGRGRVYRSPYGMIRVALAEDNLLVREGIIQVLATTGDLEVVAVCEDYGAVREAIEQGDVDVLLTDIRMPPSQSDEGIRLATRLRSSHPAVGVVVLSQYDEPAYAVRLFADGSAGRAYLLKERVRARGELASAIRSVAEGGSVVDPKIVEGLVAARVAAERSALSELTPREHEVLAQIAQGKSNTAIAESLVLTKRAVEKHINAIFLKLDLAFADDVSKRVKAALLFLAEPDDGAGDRVA